MDTFENKIEQSDILKPCPGCGNDAYIFRHGKRQKNMETGIWRDVSEYSVLCRKCSFRTGPLVMNRDEVIKDWNKRVEKKVS